MEHLFHPHAAFFAKNAVETVKAELKVAKLRSMEPPLPRPSLVTKHPTSFEHVRHVIPDISYVHVVVSIELDKFERMFKEALSIMADILETVCRDSFKKHLQSRQPNSFIRSTLVYSHPSILYCSYLK